MTTTPPVTTPAPEDTCPRCERPAHTDSDSASVCQGTNLVTLLRRTAHMFRAQLAEVTKDRDEWRTQHENALACWRSDVAAVANADRNCRRCVEVIRLGYDPDTKRLVDRVDAQDEEIDALRAQVAALTAGMGE